MPWRATAMPSEHREGIILGRVLAMLRLSYEITTALILPDECRAREA
jgi:hypothetical protein